MKTGTDNADIVDKKTDKNRGQNGAFLSQEVSICKYDLIYNKEGEAKTASLELSRTCGDDKIGIVEKLEDALHRGVLCEATMCDLFQELNAIHKDEPPLSVTLNLMAHNEALYQLSGDNLSHVKEHKEHLRWYERFLANWLDLKSAV